MTTAPLEKPPISRLLGAELRAEIARAGTTARQVAMALGRPSSWLSTRISTTAAVNLTVEEVEAICAAIGADSEQVIVNALRARRDSNPQPSDPEPVLRLIHGPRAPRPGPWPRPRLYALPSVQPDFTPDRVPA